MSWTHDEYVLITTAAATALDQLQELVDTAGMVAVQLKRIADGMAAAETTGDENGG